MLYSFKFGCTELQRFVSWRTRALTLGHAIRKFKRQFLEVGFVLCYRIKRGREVYAANFRHLDEGSRIAMKM